MNLSLADQYYIKALDAYPYDLESVTEHLQYALSYDDEHAQALCLLGQLKMYQLKDYMTAKSCFIRSLKCNKAFPDTYKHLSLLYVWLGDYKKAENLIQHGFKVAGMDHCTLLRILAIAHEYRSDLKQAKYSLERAGSIAINDACIQAIDGDLKRINTKAKVLKAKKKGKKSK